MLKLRYKSTIKAETKAMENKIYDIIIIGGGIAGLTAAVYAGRAGKTAPKGPGSGILGFDRGLGKLLHLFYL